MQPSKPPCAHLWYPQAKQQDFCLHCRRLKKDVEAEEQAALDQQLETPAGVKIIGSKACLSPAQPSPSLPV